MDQKFWQIHKIYFLNFLKLFHAVQNQQTKSLSMKTLLNMKHYLIMLGILVAGLLNSS